MSLLDIAAIIMTVSALASFINYRFFKLPTTIGLMLIALIVSLILIGFGQLGFGFKEQATSLVQSIDFNETVLQGMLGFLLFAGALHVDINSLAQKKWVIGAMATVGVMMSTVLVGLMTWGLTGLLGIQLPLIYCFLFGALISPTDPIAVLGILKVAGAPKSLEVKITGESLFNDGVGVVIFLVLLGIATSGAEISAAHVAELFVVEVIGGAIYGFAIGYGAYWMLKQVDNYQVEILITLALVMGGYALASALHLSGPIAVVIAGLLLGNRGRLLAMTEKTQEHLDTFWELLDEILNAVLFVLIGLEVLALTFTGGNILMGLLMIPAVLLARFVSIGVPVSILKYKREYSAHAVKIMTWCGLRGGISVALALSIPSVERELILVMTYIVVVFSIVVQGLTIGKMIKYFQPSSVDGAESRPT